MKTVDIVIPTRGRAAKLIRTLESIPDAAGDVKIRIIVGFDGDPDTAHRFEGYPLIDKMFLFQGHKGSIAARNRMIRECEDAVLYAVDDIVFEKGAIESAVASMQSHFPDDDGVIGFKVSNANSQCKAGVGLIGNAFLQRYPDRQLFHPGYFHFGAQEILWAAEHLKKFYFDQNAKILHFHPSFFPKETDRTHLEARKARDKDHELMKKREAAGLIWGING